MMKSEFIERVGFEPTADEYREIEQEYMGCDIDKDQFCKEWKKNGGIQRLMRLRARRIEELEAEVRKREKEYDELDRIRVETLVAEQNRRMEDVKSLTDKMNDFKRKLTETEADLDDWMSKAKEAERKLAILREAFAILGLGKEVEK